MTPDVEATFQLLIDFEHKLAKALCSQGFVPITLSFSNLDVKGCYFGLTYPSGETEKWYLRSYDERFIRAGTPKTALGRSKNQMIAHIIKIMREISGT